jgi:hypothetical protein
MYVHKRRQNNKIIVCDDAILPIFFIYPLYKCRALQKKNKYITDCLDNFYEYETKNNYSL